MDSVQRTVVEWIRQACSCRCAGSMVTLETELLDQGLLDSLTILELMAYVEKTFNVVMPLEEFVPENFTTPKAVAAMVHRRVPGLA
jgi:acyl carrier protein